MDMMNYRPPVGTIAVPCMTPPVVPIIFRGPQFQTVTRRSSFQLDAGLDYQLQQHPCYENAVLVNLTFAWSLENASSLSSTTVAIDGVVIPSSRISPDPPVVSLPRRNSVFVPAFTLPARWVYVFRVAMTA